MKIKLIPEFHSSSRQLLYAGGGLVVAMVAPPPPTVWACCAFSNLCWSLSWIRFFFFWRDQK